MDRYVFRSSAVEYLLCLVSGDSIYAEGISGTTRVHHADDRRRHTGFCDWAFSVLRHRRSASNPNQSQMILSAPAVAMHDMHVYGGLLFDVIKFFLEQDPKLSFPAV